MSNRSSRGFQNRRFQNDRNNFRDRKESSIINIRTYHNWVKRELITQSCEYLKENYDIESPTLLDLSCGKAGDQNKWISNGIMTVVGFDIDAESIREAKRRYNEMIMNMKKKGESNLPNYEFYVMDLSDPNNLDRIDQIIGGRKFDIVSCQFAIHYFFKTQVTMDTFMTIVSRYIKHDGIFIGTTMNGDKIMELMGDKNVIENEIFKIVGKEKSGGMYGNTYVVSLGKESDTDHYFAGKDSVEYLVTNEGLHESGKRFGLTLVGDLSFRGWYDSFGKDILSPKDKEFSFLNFTFVFVPDRT